MRLEIHVAHASPQPQLGNPQGVHNFATPLIILQPLSRNNELKTAPRSLLHLFQHMPRIRALLRIFRLPTARRARRQRLTAMLIALLALLALLLPLLIVYKPPSLVIRWLTNRFPDVLFQIDTKEKVIALTIDDAPSQYTPQILEVLKANDARATFFVIGGQVHGPHERQLLVDIIKGGNELGNHAMHDEPAIGLSDYKLASEVAQVNEIISAAYTDTGVERPEQRLFRPGSGLFNKRMRELMQTLGYRIVLGGIYPHDAQISWWRVNAMHILSGVGQGGVVICHDRRSWTAPMLRKVLPKLKRRGYEVVTVTELLRSSGKSS